MENDQHLDEEEFEDEWEEEWDEEVIWAGHYSSAHEILLVGEGDFSFSLSLATTFGSARNLVATSLDTYDAVVSKYANARRNLRDLSRCGATVLHGVDATRMRLDPDLRHRRFDRIVFNFPHAGFKGREDNPALIGLHRRLVQGFLRNAKGMLRDGGKVHVSHKTGETFCRWDLPGLARGCGMEVVGVEAFRVKDYPGYRNKRGDGARADQPFPLGECCTYMFVPGRRLEKRRRVCDGAAFALGDRNDGVAVPATPPPQHVASFGSYIPSPNGDGRGCSWSIQIHSPVRPIADGVTRSPPFEPWPSTPLRQPPPPPPAAAGPQPADYIWRSSGPSAPALGYLQRAYEDEVLARCERLLGPVQQFGTVGEEVWKMPMAAPPSPSSFRPVTVQQPRRGVEAADDYRNPYWIY